MWSRRRRVYGIVPTMGLLGFLASGVPLFGQINFSSRTVGGGVAGSAAARSSQMSGTGLSTAGLQQTGQVQARGAIQRTDTGFVGASGQSMVDFAALRGGGGNAATATGVPGGLAALSRSGLGTQMLLGLGRGGLGQFGQFNQMGLVGQQRTGQQQQQMRIPVRLGISPVRTTAPVAAGRFAERLNRIPALRNVASKVEVTVEGRAVVLRGTVATEHERDLLARLALLEPGIDEVRNELQVQAPVP
ncbi:MAG: hypothetical protein KatS3mg110_0203 [Pirellulaceae bacterium]|nr:MAG: hypothetical protein KatS3mg110_0203 [Pirellulaceae bacterium]